MGRSSRPRFDLVGLSVASVWTCAVAGVSVIPGAGSSSLSAEVDAVTPATGLGAAGYTLAMRDHLPGK